MSSHSLKPDSRLVALMVLLVLFSPLAIDIYLPAMPAMAAEFDVSATRIQDTISWFLVSLGLGQVLAGPLADRFGRRPVAIGGIVIYCLSSAFAWLATSLDALLVARLMQGAGACATSVCAFAAVRDSFGGKRSGQMISYLNGAICFIPALAPLLGAWLTAQFGWRSNFSFMMAYALVALVLVLTLFRETRPADTDSSGPLLSPSRYWQVLKEPVFVYHALLCMLAMSVILAYVTSAPVRLINGLGLTMEQFTVWFSVNAALNITASMTTPTLMDKIGSRKTLNAGMLMLVFAGLLMAGLSGIQQAWAFMVPVFFASFGFAWVLGSAAGKALEPFGQRAGTAAALLGLFQMSGSGVLVSLTQRAGLSEPHLLVFHMLLLAPGLLLLWSSKGKRWHTAEV
ncbi:Bcr/CflA family drug resistance efflux transporter [Grimontia hollisae]|uniref:Bcr/CflA family efflux transporter n=2 Tax=Grimontia hollisae TaxID=673 RepID=D0I380_GRIHO|nr:multidrug effflux MFS transporter [Grimontia hollisae]AMG30662.1 Bcr/CflA family drug resistance efflux transporter [Grimontia hollisae]EEY74122.1 multidrug resistance transporter Bcr/CflA family [Grimontia hollisae CIP 101886]STO47703.1 Multidrug resistance protein MdtL [Grimontia hollisae]STO58515.1 Multidrug resistance protein MdtL [Grimontia hollisae]